MRAFIAILLVLLCSSFAFAASGDKTPAAKAKFHTISSSTKRTCTQGEMRIDKSYLYVCYSSVAGKWKRVSLGNPY